MEKVFNPCFVVNLSFFWVVYKNGVATVTLVCLLLSKSQILFIRHSDQGCVKEEEAAKSAPHSRDPSRPPLMLTKLTDLSSCPPVFCSPGGPSQWCAAASNSAPAKSMLPKSSTPKSSRPEVRQTDRRAGNKDGYPGSWLFFRGSREREEAEASGRIFIMMCERVCPRSEKPTLAYFSECLIPACEASTSVPT